MTNLLPQHARRSVIIEYWIRVGTVWSVMLTCGFLALGVLLFPTYRVIQSERELVGGGEDIVTAEPISNTDGAVQIVEETNILARELEQKTVLITLSEVIAAVNTAAIEGVRIRSYDVVRNGTAVQRFQIQGVASTREVLAAFKTSLENQALFASAEVPIGDLVRDTNLPFVITVDVAESFNK